MTASLESLKEQACTSHNSAARIYRPIRSADAQLSILFGENRIR